VIGFTYQYCSFLTVRFLHARVTRFPHASERQKVREYRFADQHHKQ